jgi:hypothetical protein
VVRRTKTNSNGSYLFLGVPAGGGTIGAHTVGGLMVGLQAVMVSPNTSTSAPDILLFRWPEPVPTPCPIKDCDRDTTLPSSTWISPSDGQLFSNPVHFAAHAYDNAGGSSGVASGIAKVNFTAWWPSLGSKDAPWKVVCSQIFPTHDDVYECNWNFAGAPAGDIHVSFDVYDRAGNHTRSPNTERIIRYTPPSDGGIEIVSVSSHSVAPGERFRPSVTVRVKSGELRQDRGDMLRCNDPTCNSDATVRFGAFPHVAVEGTTGTEQTYTFTFYEDDPMIAPGTPGTYTSNWRVWRAGHWAGSNIPITFRVELPQPSEPTALTGDWELNYEIYRWLRSDGSTVEVNERATVVARFSAIEKGFTGRYLYVSGDACVDAEINGSVQDNQVNWKTRFTGPPCQGAEVVFEGTLNPDGITMTGTVSPVRPSPEGRAAWARVTARKVTRPSV